MNIKITGTGSCIPKKTKLNSFFDTGREVQSRVYNFIATFFSLYVSKERIPKSPKDPHF